MAYANESRIFSFNLVERFNSLRAELADRNAKYKIYRSTQNELNALTDRDLADLGIHRSGIQEIAFQAAYGR
jgi:uncharacterized protein YjiS (DUF1127 family)